MRVHRRRHGRLGVRQAARPRRGVWRASRHRFPDAPRRHADGAEIIIPSWPAKQKLDQIMAADAETRAA